MWCMFLIPPLGRHVKAKLCEFKVSQGYTVTLSQNKINQLKSIGNSWGGQ